MSYPAWYLCINSDSASNLISENVYVITHHFMSLHRIKQQLFLEKNFFSLQHFKEFHIQFHLLGRALQRSVLIILIMVTL